MPPSRKLHRMVKCADCGFLALRDFESRELREAEREIRETGSQGDRSTGVDAHGIPRFEPIYEAVALCIQGIRNFSSTPIQGATFARRIDPFAHAIQEDFECERFFDWREGLSPKEHLEIQARDQVLDRQTAIQSMAWQREDARDKTAEEWHRAELETLRNQHRWQLIVFGGLIGAATIAAGILDGLVSRGVDLLPF